MRIDLSTKSGKFLLFMFLAVPILIIGFLITFFTLQASEETTAKEPKTEERESAEVDSSSPPKEKTEVKNPAVPDVRTITEEDKAASKLVAEKFATAYGNYDAENPHNFVDNAIPYMSEGLRSKWEEEPPRRPLALVKSTVKKVETFPVDGGDKYTIAWNVILTEEQVNPLGDIVPMEEWVWVVLKEENGQWKVREVDITNG